MPSTAVAKKQQRLSQGDPRAGGQRCAQHGRAA